MLKTYLMQLFSVFSQMKLLATFITHSLIKNNDNKPKLDSIKNIIRTWYFKVPTDLTLRSKHPIYFIHSQNYNFALFPQPTCDISLEYKQHYCSLLK